MDTKELMLEVEYSFNLPDVNSVSYQKKCLNHVEFKAYIRKVKSNERFTGYNLKIEKVISEDKSCLEVKLTFTKK